MRRDVAHNQSRAGTRLPGSNMPSAGRIPNVRIYQPAPSVLQAGLRGRNEWALEFEPTGHREIDPLTGWRTGRKPFHSIGRLTFPDQSSAIAFAEKNGWSYYVTDPVVRPGTPRFRSRDARYDLGDALAQAYMGRESWPSIAV